MQPASAGQSRKNASVGFIHFGICWPYFRGSLGGVGYIKWILCFEPPHGGNRRHKWVFLAPLFPPPPRRRAPHSPITTTLHSLHRHRKCCRSVATSGSGLTESRRSKMGDTRQFFIKLCIKMSTFCANLMWMQFLVYVNHGQHKAILY